MKTVSAKFLSTAALALVVPWAATAANHNSGPWPADPELPWQSPALIQYFEQRKPVISFESRPSTSPFPSAADEVPVWHSPALLRYFKEKEERLAREAVERRAQSNSHYLPAGPRVSID